MSSHGRLAIGATAVFGARAVGLFTNAATTIVLARLLSPGELGSYYLLVLIPPTMLALLSFGVPAALTYFTGRGTDLDEVRTLALLLAIGLSGLIIAGLLLLLPVLATTVFAAAPADLIQLVALGIPSTFVISFCNAVLLGRQRLRAYNALLASQAIMTFGSQVLVVGILHGGLRGAIATYVVVTALIAVASASTMIRLSPFRPRTNLQVARALTRYGVTLQPASLSGFFSYRADVFLLSALLRDSSMLGVYGLAVNIAELCFYVPDSVSTVLFPRVAAIGRIDAAVLVPAVCRTALMLTAGAAALIAGAMLVGLPVLLPAYLRSVPPALILLPGVVSLSASKVLSGYMSGIDRPGVVSSVATGTLVVNLAVNLVLIPHLGPVGAATASLVSYSLNGALMVTLAAREAGVSMAEMVRPGRADADRIAKFLMSPLRSRLMR